MKNLALFLWAVALIGVAYLAGSRPSAAQPVDRAPPVAATGAAAMPMARAEDPPPVQTLDERGDAMLFEIDALQGLLFDQAVVMPFD